jgi:Programmed cell death protein 2, C-terminal putative domain
LPPEEGTKDSETHALMYLYVCTKVNCGKEPGSWRALRCQWRSPTLTTEPPSKVKSTNTTSKTKPATTLSTSGWGLGDTKIESDSKPAAGGFDFSDLEAALDAMNQKTSLVVSMPTVANTSTAAAGKEEEKVEEVELNLMQLEDEPVPLPGFYLDVAESQFIENRLEKQSGHSRGKNNIIDDDSLSHVLQLLEKYGGSTSEGEIERLINYEDDEEEGEKERDRNQKPRAGSGAGTKIKEENADPVTWDGEGYEEDVVLAVEGRKGVDHSFLKFMKKLQRIPDQCVRQGRGGGDDQDQEMLLWPSSKRKAPDAGVCTICGAPRVFEYQLMAPAIAALEESADWLKEEGLEDGAVERPPSSWDWVTVAVFGCRERCFGGSDGVYREERVVSCQEE